MRVGPGSGSSVGSKCKDLAAVLPGRVARGSVASRKMACPPNSHEIEGCHRGVRLGWWSGHIRRPSGVGMPNAKRLGWAIYAAGFVIWCFGYLSAGHASLIDWAAATPWWIASFVPNLEAEIGLALMFVSMIPFIGAQH
jgi:hypothetical protein